MKEDLYLVHHGIKGQKWGVRRYQNLDGTLTEAGKKRKHLKVYTDINKDPDKRTDGPTSANPKDFIIKKGSIFYRSTTEPNEKFRDRMFVTQEPNGSYALDVTPKIDKQTGEWIKSKTYIYKNRRRLVIAGKEALQNALKKNGLEHALDYDSAEADFYMNNKKVANNISAELRKLGYDGLMDPVDSAIGIYYTRDPMIIINDVLDKVGEFDWGRY